MANGQSRIDSNNTYADLHRRKPFLNRSGSVVSMAKTILSGGLIFVPIFIFYRIIYQNAVNVPFDDDFESALQFLSNYLYQTPTAVGKVRLLFSQFHEHRIVFDRLVFLADYYLDGYLNFRHLTLIGNASIFFIAVLLLLVLRRKARLADALVFFVPVAFMLFQFHYWEVMIWSMASLQNLYVIVFGLLSFYALSQSAVSRSWFVLALIAALVATFTSGNGLFAFIVGVPVLLFLRQPKKLIIWVGLAGLVIGFYFWGYEKPGQHPPIFDSLLHHTAQAVTYFFAVTGSVFAASSDSAIRAGKFFVLFFALLAGWHSFRGQLKANLTLWALVVFVYISCLSLTATRSGFGVVQAFSPRYGILSILLLIGLYLLTLQTVTNRYVKGSLVVVFGAIAVFLFKQAYEKNAVLLTGRTKQLQFYNAFYVDNPADQPIAWHDTVTGRAIFADAVKRKIYSVPAITFETLKSKAQPTQNSPLVPTNTVVSESRPHETPTYLVFFDAWAFLKGVPSNEVRTEVIAQSTDNTYRFATAPTIQSQVASRYQVAGYQTSGFACVIKKGDLPPGRYAVWLALTHQNRTVYQPLNLAFEGGRKQVLSR